MPPRIKEKLSETLRAISNRTRVLALISLIAEGLFVASLFTLPKEHVIFGLGICVAVLVIMILGIVILDRAESKESQNKTHTGTLEKILAQLNQIEQNNAPNGILERLSTQLNRIEQSNARHETLEKIFPRLDQIEQIARHDSSRALVAALLGLQDNLKVHCHAGGLTISSLLLKDLPRTATQFYKMGEGKEDKLTLTEHQLVDNFLLHLIKALPDGSIWFGITRLQNLAAWRRKSTTAAYYDFQRIAEIRTRNQALSYFRLWAFDDEKHVQAMRDVMDRQCEAGFQARISVGRSLDDISMIWIPTKPMQKALAVRDLNAPIDEMDEKADLYQSLCAIKFEARGGRELDEMTIFSPSNDAFRRLCIHFQENWKTATDAPSKGKEKSSTKQSETA
jgi:hypothetical protein